MKKILLLLFITIFFTPLSLTFAQYQSPIDGVTISNSPEKPGPGDTVTISVESYLIDLNSASIIWRVNGKDTEHGIGLKSIKIIAPPAGKKTTVSVIIGANNGKEVRKSVTIKSGSVELVWETKTYSPPFFKGKNPFVYENFIKVIAVPHLSLDGVKEVNPKNLVYKWKRGGKYIEGVSTYGVQSIEIQADEIPKPLDISVEVYTRDQNESAVASMRLEPIEPSVLFYEISPLYGILFNKALSNTLNLTASEVTLLAAPFGFNYNPKNSKLSYVWSINNSEQPDLIKKQSITLRSKGDIEGSSDISIDVRSENDILERAINNIKVNFKKKLVESEEITF